MSTALERRERLKAVYEEARGCVACRLHDTRTTVVFGSGNADADLMFVGEAPGANEDRQGLPFVGQAGKLLDKLLEEIGMTRQDVFVANVLKCLSYKAMVQLGDGSWERIGRLVSSRYAGEVMSVDASGRLVPRRVIGWHANPLGGRRVFRLSFRSAKPHGNGSAHVEVTGDHPVLTERGYVPVEQLSPHDRIATGQGVSEPVWDLVCGTLLGDGTIGRQLSALTCSHPGQQASYARFKAEVLRELDARIDAGLVAAVAGGTSADEVVHLRTPAHRALRVLRHEFHGDVKRVPQWMAEKLTPRMLAVWFMDDGYNRIRGGGRQPLAEIATNGFADGDLQILIRGLERLGLSAKALRGRLFFDVPTTRQLSEMIAPFVPPGMRYKLNPEVEGRVPFDPSRWEGGPAQVLFDDVVVEDITAKPRGDTTFFCIDVEGTHNFVTTGGVVHNCRPPGNRDPQPEEIASCRGYLYSQLDLIEPTVVCTLGNFSTKLLRGDPTGITRLHGQPEVRVIGPRAVRLYPLFHPAAALYTPSTLELLRADFQRIPDLLAQGPPPQPEHAVDLVVPEPPPEPEPPREPEPLAEPETAPGLPEPAPPAPPEQLGLF